MKLRVFLSSPGDVADERGLARKVLARLQQEAAFGGRLFVEDASWDNPAAPVPLAAWLPPQEAINRGRPKPADCDVVLVILWSRTGTPLPDDHVKPDGGRYQSGTEWEFLNAIAEAERRQDGTPLVLVYRRMKKVLLDPDAADFAECTEQRRRVQGFFDGFRSRDGSLRRSYQEYVEPTDFEMLVERQLRDFFWRRLQSAGIGPAAAAGGEGRAEWHESPYPGLRAFTPSEAPIFFGRGRETDDLVARFTRDDARFLAVIGASGSGKSSLVAAGLLPRLAAGAVQGRPWTSVRCTPGWAGDDPFLALAVELGRAFPKPGWKPPGLARRLGGAAAGTLAEVAQQALADHPPPAELVLFVDQLEELFTLAAERYRKPFVDLIAAAVDTERLRTVVTLRADFYARCMPWEPLVRLLRDGGSYPLGLPGPQALAKMITRPAQAAGRAFDDGLVDRILEDTGTGPGALALLAFALHELYGARTREGRLTAAAYDAFGGVRRAIGKRAEDVFTSLPVQVQTLLGDVFRELVEVDERGVATRRRIPRARLASSAQLVDSFVDARLLVTDRGAGGEPVAEVAHEALLREWPRLAAWVSDFADDLRLRQQAEAAARDWQRAGRDPSHLWPHERLVLVERALQRLGIQRSDLDEPARTFLRPEAERLLDELERPGTTHFRRAEIGDRLDTIGDPRPGVGLRPDGLPDIVWCEVPGGTITLEGVEGSFVVEPFAIAKHPITYWQYRAFLDDPQGYRDKRWWKHLKHEKAQGEQVRPTGNCPADNVSWYDAMAYCRWLSERLGVEVRLPTEWEWQQAATGGRADYEYPWGLEWIEGCANTYEGRLSRTTAVGMYPRGASTHGVRDLAGNVWEWCLNKHRSPRDCEASGAGPGFPVRAGPRGFAKHPARCYDAPMPSLPARGVHSTYAEYLEIEAASPIRHEYLAGEILAMAGGTPEHAALQVAVSGALLRQLTGRPCRVFSSDLRLRVPATGLATYAGVTVVCGRVERDAEDENAVVNRIVLVEITSKRTEAYDRGEKFEHYRTIPSLREYLIVSHREPRIDLWRRPASGGAWAEMRAGAGDSALLESIDCRLDVDEVFADAGDDLDAEEREALHAALDRAWAGARAGIFGPPTTSSRSSAPGNDDSRPRHARGGGAGGASSGRPPRGLRVWSEGVGVALTGPP